MRRAHPAAFAAAGLAVLLLAARCRLPPERCRLTAAAAGAVAAGVVRQVNSGPCPLCRRPLDWDRLVETMRHCRANGLDVATADAEEVPYNLRSNAAVAARAGALGEAGHVASALAPSFTNALLSWGSH